MHSNMHGRRPRLRSRLRRRRRLSARLRRILRAGLRRRRRLSTLPRARFPTDEDAPPAVRAALHVDPKVRSEPSSPSCARRSTPAATVDLHPCTYRITVALHHGRPEAGACATDRTRNCEDPVFSVLGAPPPLGVAYLGVHAKPQLC